MNIKQKLLVLVKEKKPILILAAGLLGILLLLVSELSGGEKEEVMTVESSLSEYEKELSDKLAVLISQIDGAGRTQLMLTLECGEESVYARDTNEKIEEQYDTENEKLGSNDTNFEYKYIIIKSGGSNEGGLLLMTLEPRVRGVAVVCEGADSAIVRQRITETVCAALDVSAARVSVAKMTS